MYNKFIYIYIEDHRELNRFSHKTATYSLYGRITPSILFCCLKIFSFSILVSVSVSVFVTTLLLSFYFLCSCICPAPYSHIINVYWCAICPVTLQKQRGVNSAATITTIITELAATLATGVGEFRRKIKNI